VTGLVVDAREVKKVYGGVEPLEVLHDVSLQVAPGEFVAVVGQSGSGKSTLLNLIGALDRPTAGTIVVDGARLDRLTDNALAALRNTRIGFIFQYHHLLEEFSCLENALMPLYVRGEPSAADVARVRDLLERVGLGGRLSHRPNALSGGEQQRTAVVRALAAEPRLVLADEPTGNLDTFSGNQVFTLMRDMNRVSGVAFILVTHDERLASAADRELRIESGHLVAVR
jgi:ABC-type lipoprotein export system ATPase subunit